MSALDTAAQVRAGQRCALDVVEESLAAIESRNADLNAVLLVTADAARAAGKGVSVCGEMAGDPVFTEFLLAMGLRSFSMHPAQVASIKQRVLRADVRMLRGQVAAVLAADSPQDACQSLMRSRVH